MSDATVASGSFGERRSRRSGFGRSIMLSAARGAGLIAVAIVIGIVLLQVVDNGNGSGGGGKVKAGGNPTTSTTSSSSSSSSTSTTSSKSPVKPPSQVSVLVLNGTSTQGAAGKMSDQLRAKGYQMLPASDSAARTGTIVYYRDGFEREAAALATAVGGSTQVAAITSPEPKGTRPDANCIVILGA